MSKIISNKRSKQYAAISDTKSNVANSQLSSNAYNYNIGGSINPRTGSLSISISIPTMSGQLGHLISPTIFLQQNESLISSYMLGLPLGWSYAFSYIYDNRLFVRGQKSYWIDSNYPSGLRYYTLKNMTFSQRQGTWKKKNININYNASLFFLNGEKEYFDINGRVVVIEDRYGNYVLFFYKSAGDVYSSKIESITNEYEQKITFDYDLDGILGVKISYPTAAAGQISFSYLKDSNGYLACYQNAIGERIVIENKGGLVRGDLISKITYPNNLITSYDYTTIKYYTDANHTNTKRIDCVSRVQSSYNNQPARTVTYNYDPNRDAHNFTGYNKYGSFGEEDVLLQEGSSFTYSTEVDDGIFITCHKYNHLHLEVETNIYSRIDAPNNYPVKGELISSTVNKYAGQRSDGYFPRWSDLIHQYPNYQTPVKVESTIYNERRESITNMVETVFDLYGNPSDIKKYLMNVMSKNLILNSEEKIIYDYKHYGLVTQKDVYDYSQDVNRSIARREVNTFTDDGKSVATTTTGLLDNGIFHSNQKATFEYDSVGRVIHKSLEWVDGQDHGELTWTKSDTEYSLEGLVMNIINIDAKENRRLRQIDAMTGWILKETDSLGRTTSYLYDKLGRKLSVINPVGLTKKWIYDDKQNKITELYNSGYKKFYYYNVFGQPIKVADNIGIDGAERILKQRTYYAETGQLYTEEGILGKKSRITYEYDDRGNVASKTDALGNINSYKHDQANQSVITYFNDIETSKLQSNLNTQTSEIYSSESPKASVKSANTVNAYNKVITENLGIERDSVYRIKTTYDYDVNLDVINSCTMGKDGLKILSNVVRDLFGNAIKNSVQLKSIDSDLQIEANSTEYFYNTLNQLTKELSVLGQTLNEYDSAGQQIKHTDYAGTVFTSTYDKDGRISTSVYQDKAGKKHFREYTYDQNRQLISLKETVDGTSQTLSYSYTALENQLAAITYPDGKSVKYVYDRFSRPWQFIDVMGQVTQYSYDDFGRLSNLEILHTDYSASIVYYSKDEDKANSGKVKNITFNNKVQKKYVYNGFGLIDTSIVIDTAAPQEANIINKIVYTYDSVTHNIIKMDYSSNIDSNNKDLNYTVEYTYNSLNQLIIEKTSDTAGKLLSSTNYTHDAASNIILEEVYDAAGVMTRISYIYDADNKLLSTQKQVGQGPTTTIQFKYDKNGNLIDDGQGAIFIYNEVNQLVEYKNQNITAVYTYYPDGLRASKKVNDSNAIQFYYDGSAVALLVNEIQGDKSTSYFMHGSERYIRLVKGNDNTSVHYALTNGKDTIGLLGNNKNFEKVYKYSPYGEEKNRLLIGVSDINENPFLYASEYVDAESGLIYLRARYYNPGIKRFMSRDVTKLFNRYIYASANPIMNVDPTGHISWLNIGLDIAAIAASVAAVVAAPFSGGSSIAIGAAVVGGILGVTSGATGIAAEATNNKNLATASMVTGIAAAAVDLASIGTGIASAVRSEISALNAAGRLRNLDTFTIDESLFSMNLGSNLEPTNILGNKGERMFINFADDRGIEVNKIFAERATIPEHVNAKDAHVVFVHGSEANDSPLMLSRWFGGRQQITVGELAIGIKPYIQDGRPIKLVSCGNNATRAQELADWTGREVFYATGSNLSGREAAVNSAKPKRYIVTGSGKRFKPLPPDTVA